MRSPIISITFMLTVLFALPSGVVYAQVTQPPSKPIAGSPTWTNLTTSEIDTLKIWGKKNADGTYVVSDEIANALKKKIRDFMKGREDLRIKAGKDGSALGADGKTIQIVQGRLTTDFDITTGRESQ